MSHKNLNQEVFSAEGGKCEADPMSDPEDGSQWQAKDVIRRWRR